MHFVRIPTSLRPPLGLAYSILVGRLTTIILTSNDINEIPFPTQRQSRLPAIRSVSLSANGIGSWRDIDALAAWCPGLETLYIRGNPLVQGPRNGEDGDNVY